ncbi:uncharacterized protein LOC142173730 [Nicotiana tabacum]|uniref:Uncharacterized protein LOC142173730 n=1 Tax=Nicotiana tabacum TaxID=4097 RepID=A0AC58TE14_TOBAC
MGELETGRGLNQELGLARAADTRWGSHYKYFKNFISMFGSIIDVLDTIVVDAWTLEERAKAKGYLSSFVKHLRFSNLQGLVDLSETLVKTNKHLNYPFVFCLVKFGLLLPVATATVERTFSAMKLIKSELRNRMNDEFMSGCLVPYVESKIFNTISDETIMNTFQEMKTRRG